MARELAFDEAALGLPADQSRQTPGSWPWPRVGPVARSSGRCWHRTTLRLPPAGARNLISAGRFRAQREAADRPAAPDWARSSPTRVRPRWAGQAANALFRGVVAASSVVSARDEVLTEH